MLTKEPASIAGPPSTFSKLRARLRFLALELLVVLPGFGQVLFGVLHKLSGRLFIAEAIGLALVLRVGAAVAVDFLVAGEAPTTHFVKLAGDGEGDRATRNRWTARAKAVAAETK